MDPIQQQRPMTTAYYPSPPPHDDPNGMNPPSSRPQHMSMPYLPTTMSAPLMNSSAPLNGAMPMNTPTVNGHMSMQPRNDMPAPPAVMNGQPSLNEQATVNGHGGTPGKQNRLSKACDGCSVRKVKCDEEGPPCRACRSLQIPCTFNRPSRRRGPPNRHAEAIKRQKIEPDASPTMDGQATNAVNDANLSPTASFSSGSPANAFHRGSLPHLKAGLTAESICPFEVLTLLVDDFFTYMHPLYPFPHEPSFRNALFQERRDTRDPRFLALVSSMIGCLVSTYPRQPLKRLKQTNKKHLFRFSQDFCGRCKDIAVEVRSNNLFAKKDLGIYDAATSFFLGQIATNSFTVSEGELFFNECFNILRAVGYQRFHDERGQYSLALPANAVSFGQAPSTPQHPNLIDREVGFRLYWTLYQLVRSAFSFAFGSGVADVSINPDTPLRRHPPFPLEVDDDRIFPDHVDPQPQGTPTAVTALNHVCRMHLQYEPIKAFKIAWAVDEGYDMDKQNEVYRKAMSRAVEMFEDPNMPPAFRMNPSHQQQPQSYNQAGILSPSVGSAPNFPSTSPTSAHSPNEHDRRQIGIEIQKANIHTTYITTRAFYLEKFWGSNGFNPVTVGQNLLEIQDERLRSGRRLLDVLSQVRPEHLEPCAFAFAMQVRQVASTLYSSSQGNRHAEVKEEEDGLEEKRKEAHAYVEKFLKMLVRLEKGGRGNRGERRGSEECVDEEEELKLWSAKACGEQDEDVKRM